VISFLSQLYIFKKTLIFLTKVLHKTKLRFLYVYIIYVCMYIHTIIESQFMRSNNYELHYVLFLIILRI